jgi:hypothetical protein
MATITLQFDAKNSLANSIIQSIKDAGVFQITEATSPYDKEFVKEIQKSRYSKGKKIKTADLWT